MRAEERGARLVRQAAAFVACLPHINSQFQQGRQQCKGPIYVSITTIQNSRRSRSRTSIKA